MLISSILECTSASGSRVRPASIRVPFSLPTSAPNTVEFLPESIEKGSEDLLHVHAPCTSGDPPALLQALEFALAGVLGLALHEIIVVVLAPGADEE